MIPIMAIHLFLAFLLMQMVEQLCLIAQQAQEILCLKTRNQQLENENQQFKEQSREFQNRLALNSHNSHKPPASDGFQKSKSRKKHQPRSFSKKAGGQPDHPGRTLQAVEQPDHTLIHQVDVCDHCQRRLEDVPSNEYQKRQVFDLPPIKIEVTEHQAEIKHCPDCGHTTIAAFPPHVTQPVQYGPRLSAIGVYLTDYQLLPYDRATEALKDLYNCPISAGTLFTMRAKCAGNLVGFEQVVKEQLIQTEVVHFDETGLSVNGKGHWLHTASTPTLTWYGLHAKRGSIAMNEFDILPRFKGTAVHDFYASYAQFDCQHSQCNAHILRELTRAEEQEQATWATEMNACLLDFKDIVDAANNNGLSQLCPSLILQMEERYQQIIDRAYSSYPPPDSHPVKKKGRKKQPFAKNLLDRLSNNRDAVLRFINDFKVPFDNNLAERDLRMMKVKQKISGTYP